MARGIGAFDGDTIVAPATAAGRSAIGILRISGPAARSIAETLTGRSCPKPGLAVHRRVLEPQGGEAIDDGILLFFEGPHSSTGEDVLEIHHHGGRVVAATLFDTVLDLPGVRPAEPGEFTKRAFLNGKLDLTAAEGLADLIDATTTAQARQARRQLDGDLGTLYGAWRSTLLRALAHLEAEIDFSPEEEVPDDLFAAFRENLYEIAVAMRSHLEDDGRGERLRSGVVVAIIGTPNVGKSSLMNHLARRDVSIVTPIAGTTRDIIEVALDLDGLPVTLLDTAGLRDSQDPIEREGVSRARARAASADLIIDLKDASAPDPTDGTGRPWSNACLVVLNKIDLAPDAVPSGALGISCLSGAGMAALLTRLGEEVRQLLPEGDAPLITRARHRQAVQAAHNALNSALQRRQPATLDLAAEDLRVAARAIGQLTGHIGVEEILGEIFSTFCIGK